MTPKTRTFFGYLICVLGLTLLLFTISSYTFQHGDAFDQQSAEHSANSSGIRFSEKRIQLAAVHSGEAASGSVLVENTGSNIITDVGIKVGCACSDVNLSDTTIQPGASIKIEFSIDTRGKYGDFAENFLFTYSEEGQNLFDVFYVTVPILAPGKLVAEPSSLLFNKATVGETFSRVIELRAKDLPDGWRICRNS